MEPSSDAFIRDGYIKIENAFSRRIADQALDILWTDIISREPGFKRHDPSSWTQPVVRLGGYSRPPFVEAANTSVLHEAYDLLVGSGKWVRPFGLGTFPIRFPHSNAPGDDGWHVDASFPGQDPSDFMNWRINSVSKGRALSMLFLFTDVGPDDAPTRILPGSHRSAAKVLSPYGQNGLSFMELAEKLKHLDKSNPSFVTGPAGTVYLCHPLLVHSAQPHHGKYPRFMAQPPLYSSKHFDLSQNEDLDSPVERAIRLSIGNAA